MKLIRHETIDFLKQPPLWLLVILPIIMSVMIIGVVMKDTGQEMMLLPSWILFAQVMVGIMIIAPGFIEEKEQKTLDALMTSPLTLMEVIIAKCTTILLFSMISQLLVYSLNSGISMDLLAVIPMMIIGGIMFIQVGMVLALVMDSSKTAAAVSSIVMVVLFMTASFYQELPELLVVLQFIPSVVVVESFFGALNREFLIFEGSLLIFWLGLLTEMIYFLAKKEENK